jgi:hypothetical protein
MMNKQIVTTIVIAVIVGAAAFFGGMKYEAGKAPQAFSVQSFQNITPAQRQQLAAQFRGGRGGVGGQAGGGFINGQIIAKSDGSITVKDQSGSSHIILLTSGTQIRKSVDATSTDLQVGQNVTATGQANSDGSVASQTIQIRPATSQAGAGQ